MSKENYKKKFFDIYRFINDDYIIKNTFWKDNIIVFKIKDFMHVSIKINHDDSSDIYCFVTNKEIKENEDFPIDAETILSFNELKKYIKKIEKKIGLIVCTYCHSKFIPD